MTTTSTIEAPPDALPESIDRELRRVRGDLHRRDLTLGLARVGIAVLGFVLGTFILDRLLDFPTPFRGVVLGLGCTGLLFVLWRYLLRPLSAKRSDDEIALLIERAHPELNDELISAVQLSRGRKAWESRELIGHVVSGAATRAGSIGSGGEVETSGSRRIVFLTLAVAVIVGALFSARGRDAGIWFERMILLKDTPWPRTVELKVNVDDLVVAKGEDVTISATVVRGQPSRVAVAPTFASTGRGEEVQMIESRGEWRATFENVNDPFKFYVEGGDYRSQWYEVQVRPRPKLEEISVWVAPPAYTGIAETPQEAPLHDGNLKVPQNSVVRYQARATTPLKAADSGFTPGPAIVDAHAAQVSRDGEGRVFTGSFTVKDSTSWTLHLTSKEGFETPAAAQYAIRAIPDRLPDVRILKPGRNKDVARAASAALKIEVRDDYLPKAAALVYTVTSAKKGGKPEVETRVQLPGLPPAEGAKHATIDQVLDLAPIGLEVGDRVTYWVEAVDNRAPAADVMSVPPENRGKSERYQLHVIADDDLDRQQQNALKRIGDELAALEKTQKKAETDLEALADELKQRGDKPDPKDRRALTYAELDERKIGQRLDQVRQSFADVREEMAANKVSKEDDVRWVAELEASAERLVKEPVARAAQDLGALRQAPKPDAAKIGEVARTEAEVVEGIQAILHTLAKWDESNDARRRVGALKQSAEKRIERLNQELKK